MFKLFVIVFTLGNPGSFELKPPLEFQTNDACTEVKEFYEKFIPANRLRAVCIDDGESADDDKDTK